MTKTAPATVTDPSQLQYERPGKQNEHTNIITLFRFHSSSSIPFRSIRLSQPRLRIYISVVIVKEIQIFCHLQTIKLICDDDDAGMSAMAGWV